MADDWRKGFKWSFDVTYGNCDSYRISLNSVKLIHMQAHVLFLAIFAKLLGCLTAVYQ